MKNTLMSFCAAIGAVGAICGTAAASVISVSGPVELIAAPADASLNVLTSDEVARTWNERQNVLLTSDLRIDAKDAGVYDQVGDLIDDVVAAGTRVASHYVHFDSPESDRASIENGFITFSHRILGVIVSGDNRNNGNGKLDQSDFLGAPTTYADNVGNRGLEMGNDRFAILADGVTLHILRLGISRPGDYIRVVTEVPAPAGSLALVALGGVCGFRRKPRRMC